MIIQAPPTISIIIPCYNEEVNIVNTYNRITNEINQYVNSCEIKFVDNCGTDNQFGLMKKLYHNEPAHVRVVSLSRNFGYQMSMSSGLE